METDTLISLVLVALLYGCATPDVQCNMRTWYEEITPPPDDGRMYLAWHFGSTACGPATLTNGCEFNQVIWLTTKPDFRDVCSLAKFGHEVAHAMGARHEK